MELKPEQLVAQLGSGSLSPAYLIAGSEPLRVLEAAALAEPHVARFLEGLTVRKVIVVPGRIVNIVAT
jgi:leucyl-tRNA synthetase